MALVVHLEQHLTVVRTLSYAAAPTKLRNIIGLEHNGEKVNTKNKSTFSNMMFARIQYRVLVRLVPVQLLSYYPIYW